MTMQFHISEHFKTPGFPLTVYHDVRKTDLFLHHHEFGELVYVSNGFGLHRLGNEEYSIEAGDVFYIPEGVSHGYADIRHLELYNVLFIPSRLPLDLASLSRLPGYRLLFELEPASRQRTGFKAHLRLPPTAISAVLLLIKRLADETAHQKAGYETMATGLFLELIAVLVRAYERRPNRVSCRLMAIDSVIQHIHENYQEDWDVEILAARAKMSVRTFHRTFSAATGESPRSYVVSLRIAQAKEYLVRPDARITQAAYESGFHDGNYFSRIFRERTGKSPREWAKDARARMESSLRHKSRR